MGAGAAGLVAASFAGRGPAPVVLVERTADGGRKILISGGGRCNILPSTLAPERFVTDSPAHLMRAMLRAWPLAAQRAFFEGEIGLPLTIETDTGKLFPASNRARDVRDGLLALARRHGVTVQFGTVVTGLAPEGNGWRLETSAGPLRAGRVVMATGGLSVPATGSDGTGLALTAALGHRVQQTYPALTPLTTDALRTPHPTPHSASGTRQPSLLAGLSLPVRLRVRWAGRTTEARGGFLFTHRGYSGPAVLDVSHVCVRSLMTSADAAADEADGPDTRARLLVSWSDRTAQQWERDLMSGDQGVATVLGRVLPERLALALMHDAGIPRDRRTSALRRVERTALVARLTSDDLPWSGHEGYKKAEVTGGGVALDEVDPRTLESRHHRGLFLCGEMLDAFGPIGGHNFAWAWSTGRAAGLGAARRD
ncbi:MAG TPA: aminoacetone oxidase family FAD-binding enzyme [Vicinamibacterales bacterium]|nr:aminoacetone oxidase family FAD-binding enzyme [Vicinamibacterales bacterium]